MDIFGTISGGIDLVGKLVGYLQAVKGAKEDRLKLLSEVSALGVLLEIMRGRLDNINAGGSGDNISNMLCLVSNVPSTPGKPLFAAMRWPFHQEDIRKTLGKIERLKTMISLALQTSLMGFIEKACDELAIAGLNIEKIKSVVSSLEANQRGIWMRITIMSPSL
ncbi:hypothetical protein BD779DRAFT_1474782 [Infundibulicybe gibba]|nr:hypothetical protein BD779DRAFT_1474782 [Infundibulicybe gibba]